MISLIQRLNMKNEIYACEITGWSSDGAGVTHIDGKTVFNTARSVLQVKGQGAYINVTDATLNSAIGVILERFPNDDPNMNGIPVEVIQFHIGAILLHNKDGDSQLQDPIELVRCQFGKCFSVKPHRFPPPHPALLSPAKAACCFGLYHSAPDLNKSGAPFSF